MPSELYDSIPNTLEYGVKVLKQEVLTLDCMERQSFRQLVVCIVTIESVTKLKVKDSIPIK